ncbi:hypothetical protein LUZ60_011176 [Juncus effusus]|nr:hypothetical protein LUZ60_011176 [Juncus effusus]
MFGCISHFQNSTSCLDSPARLHYNSLATEYRSQAKFLSSPTPDTRRRRLRREFSAISRLLAVILNPNFSSFLSSISSPMLAFRASSTLALLRNSGLLCGNPRAGALFAVRKIGGMNPQMRCSSSSVSASQARVTKKTEISNDESFDSAVKEPWTVLTHKKPNPDWIAYNPRSMRPPPLSRADCKFVKFLSWNVNGLRPLLKSKTFSPIEFAQREDFDVLCLQETKIQEKDIEEVRETLIEGYKNNYWTCSLTKLGYSGTAIISRIKPISVSYGLGVADHDGEGRLLTVEFDGFYLLCSYVPNSGNRLKRLNYRVTEWDPALSNYMKELEKSKPVILTGDLNCAHQEIDIHNPVGNKRSAGFTTKERQSFEKCYLNNGFVDTFRKQNPNVVAYSYWGYGHGVRETNKGWRLDYFLVSESLMEKVYDSYILPDIGGSDHCPVGLVLKI